MITVEVWLPEEPNYVQHSFVQLEDANKFIETTMKNGYCYTGNGEVLTYYHPSKVRKIKLIKQKEIE
jgi:hypothetical protein